MNARNEARFCRLLGVVQEESVGGRRHPFFQQWDQLTSGDERRSEISEHVNDTGAVQRDVDQEVSVIGEEPLTSSSRVLLSMLNRHGKNAPLGNRSRMQLWA